MDKKLEKLKVQQDQIFGAIANILGGISSPVRIKVIHFLSQGPLTVETLSNKIDESIANTSMHLRKMLAQNIVTVSVLGKNRLYTLAPSALAFWESCQDFIQNIDPSLSLSIVEVYGEINWQESLAMTAKMAKNNEVLIIDVRPVDEIVNPLNELNVLSIPSSEILKNISKLPKKKPVLVFCRGRLCALSAFTVNELRKNGVNAYRLNESWYSLSDVA